jgi:hypothetical protein
VTSSGLLFSSRFVQILKHYLEGEHKEDGRTLWRSLPYEISLNHLELNSLHRTIPWEDNLSDSYVLSLEAMVRCIWREGNSPVQIAVSSLANRVTRVSGAGAAGVATSDKRLWSNGNWTSFPCLLRRHVNEQHKYQCITGATCYQIMKVTVRFSARIIVSLHFCCGTAKEHARDKKWTCNYVTTYLCTG